MAVLPGNTPHRIYYLAEEWRDQSLLGDTSILHPDAFPTAWSRASIEDLARRFLGNPIEGKDEGGVFASKWKVQLKDASDEVRVLAAECLLVYYLATVSVGQARKIEMINETLGSELSEFHIVDDLSSRTYPAFLALQGGISHPGQYFNTAQYIQVGYLIDFAARLKVKPEPERRTLLVDDPWGFAEFAGGGERSGTSMQHILCHLIYPESFENITVNSHKELVLKTFGGLVPDVKEDEGLDKQLFAIRKALDQHIPDWTDEQRNYYSSDLIPIWRPLAGSGEDDSLDPAFAIEYKKQIVFYGPPGTGKTFRAGQLAEKIVRTAALQCWGVTDYFNHIEKLNTAVSENVTRLQMHPSYGYPEFMVGLQLEADGSTSYKLGALPRLVERMRKEKAEQGDQALPHVLVLDEINRTDLSAMFGEAFSAMERDKRGIEFGLFADDGNGNQLTFALPENLYIIGTMNEIDQSVEALDFALRRRFFWFATPYSEEDLKTIWAAQWQEQNVSVLWEKALPQLEELAERITGLNVRITELQDLGPEYELGAAIFSDIAFFIGREWESKRHGRNAGYYLWNKKGEPLRPLRSLWSLSIKPVLEQYLAGSDRRTEQLSELEQLLFTKSPE